MIVLLAILAICGFTAIFFTDRYWEQTAERKTMTVTIIRIDANTPYANYVANYQLTFSDGSHIVTVSTAIVETFKEGHTYTISFKKKWPYLLWYITNVTEVQTP